MWPLTQRVMFQVAEVTAEAEQDPYSYLGCEVLFCRRSFDQKLDGGFLQT